LDGALPLNTTPQLRERDMGHWAKRPRKSLARQKHRLLSWTDAPDSAESQVQVARRSLAFLATLPVADTLVVAHGGVIRVVTGLLDGVPVDRIGELRVRNCEVLVRHVLPGQLQTLLESL
jgi:broad specificity phosphatase PhoE